MSVPKPQETPRQGPIVKDETYLVRVEVGPDGKNKTTHDAIPPTDMSEKKFEDVSGRYP